MDKYLIPFVNELSYIILVTFCKTQFDSNYENLSYESGIIIE